VCECELDNSNNRLLSSNFNEDESAAETDQESEGPIAENFFGTAMSNEQNN